MFIALCYCGTYHEFDSISIVCFCAPGEIMFTVHTPISACAFEWFWFEELESSGHKILKVDPSITYESAHWNAFAPVALFILISLTIGRSFHFHCTLFFWVPRI